MNIWGKLETFDQKTLPKIIQMQIQKFHFILSNFSIKILQFCSINHKTFFSIFTVFVFVLLSVRAFCYNYYVQRKIII